jgi:hypothetical protein
VNKFPGVSEALALLQRLKDAVRDFSSREEKLAQEFRARSGVEFKAYKAATEEFEHWQNDRLSQAEIIAQDELATWQTRYERRKVRINEVHKKLRRGAVEEVTTQEGRRKHRLQQNAMEAERLRDSELVNSTARLEEFRQKLAAMAESFAPLEVNARRALGRFAGLKRLLAPERQWPEPDTSPDEHQLFDELGKLEGGTQRELEHFRNLALVRVVRFTPPAWLLAILLAGAAGWKLATADARATAAIAGLGALFILRLALYFIARAQASPQAAKVAGTLAKSRRLQELCLQKADQRYVQEQEQIKADFQNTSRAIDQEYKQVVKDAIGMRDQRPRQLDEKAARVTRRNEAFHTAKMADIERLRSDTNAMIVREAEARRKELAKGWDAKQAKLKAEQDAAWHTLEAEWKTAVLPLCDTLQRLKADADTLFPEWELSRWEKWNPPGEFKNAAKFGRLEVDIEKFAGTTTRERKLPLPCDSTLSLPLALSYPREGAILFETAKTGAEEALTCINNIIFRLLSITPPGKLSFTIFDPVGLGQNFAGLMHLADYEASHINSRIWTQTSQMEEKLAELNEHMEKVIQMYLRNEYETIAEYNAQAGSIAEKYHFLVIASLPANFSDTAARRLRNIASSGARCGVYTLIQWDTRQPLPQDFVPDELRNNSVRLVRTERGFDLGSSSPVGTKLFLDSPPSPEFATHFLHQVGEASKDANRVEVPFQEIAPSDGEFWKEETAEELRVPIGRSGATKLQYLAIGKGTRQHALIAGKTGSGKSTLFHVMVTNLSLWCSPDQVEFYLVDFKKGVEFKCYASRRLPHARVVAIESDRQFGLSVLEKVDAELRRRGDLFRKLGVQDLAGYKRAGGKEILPRSLLMIDEFQEFFTEEDRISQGAAVLLDRIVRQGRAFGIHVLLGSQTLGGAYTLARATLGQMVIRIALQCNEADAYLIMDQDNPAPRLLSRPGEGIYNDAAGAIEGNSPFQAVWLPEDVRDSYLVKIRASADQNGNSYPGPFVFEGNAPADIRENLVLKELLADLGVPAPRRRDAVPRIWLGAPNSIKGPTEVAFQPQSGSNLLVVGQNEESTLAMLAASLIALAAQHPPDSARFILLDSTAPGSPQADFLDHVIQTTARTIQRPKGAALVEAMSELSEELKRRTGEEESAAGRPIYLIIHGLENFKKLRMEDEFAFSSSDSDSGPNPAVVLQNLITEGPSHGIHVIITCDTFNNVSRFLGRKTLSEFAMRVLFQMSASDSAALIDAPDAGTLGMHRALLYNDREGYMETFRPYARPGNDWLEEIGGALRGLTVA